MARGKFVLSIGDDNVILTLFVNGELKDAWMGDADPELAHEEFGEAFASDKSADLLVILDTLDQTYQQDDLPKVGLLDRRKILNRHMVLEFAGQNLRGAKLVSSTKNKMLTYQFVSIPIAGRIPEWMSFIASLPNELVGYYAIATEGGRIASDLLGDEMPPVEDRNHWQHIIGVNVTGGFRQIIQKNGELGFTRLTQAPPDDTPPDEFADNISRDFKATVTYIKRLGYVAGDALDLIILTTAQIKQHLERIDWGDARSVTIMTPFEASQKLGIGSIGSEEQGFCDVLYAAYLANQPQGYMKLTRAAIGDTKEDLRDLSFFLAPYAAGLAMLGLFVFLGWSLFSQNAVNQQKLIVQQQLAQVEARQRNAELEESGLPYTAGEIASVFSVVDSLKDGEIEVAGDLSAIFTALDGDAVVLEYDLDSLGAGSANSTIAYEIKVRLRLDQLIRTADEALEVSRRLEDRLRENFGEGYEVEMTLEPTGAQAEEELSGGLFGTEVEADAVESDEPFFAEYRIGRRI